MDAQVQPVDRVLLFDVETSGVDAEKDHVVEAAGVLFSLKHGTHTSGFTYVVKADSNAAEDVNGIPAAMLREHGAQPDAVWQRVEGWMKRADVVAAHNARFDRGFCPVALQSVRPWVCTLEDLEWPRKASGSRVVDVALAHGVGVTNPHRALTDVMTLASTLERVAELGGDLQDMFARAMRPKRRYRAVTGKYDPALNEKLKACAFRWDPAEKAWWRRLVVEEVPRLQAEYPFSIVEWAEQ